MVRDWATSWRRVSKTLPVNTAAGASALSLSCLASLRSRVLFFDFSFKHALFFSPILQVTKIRQTARGGNAKNRPYKGSSPRLRFIAVISGP